MLLNGFLWIGFVNFIYLCRYNFWAVNWNVLFEMRIFSIGNFLHVGSTDCIFISSMSCAERWKSYSQIFLIFAWKISSFRTIHSTFLCILIFFLGRMYAIFLTSILYFNWWWWWCCVDLLVNDILFLIYLYA